ncbi:MAG: hypothetical protein AAF682_29285 [Planctomycetota bacterium]
MLKPIALALVCAALSASCNSADYTLTLQNDSAVPLVPYPVVTTPPPPHREADPANTVAAGTSQAIEPTGFNPLYYQASRMLSLTLQLGLDQDPPAVLARVLRHAVEPGQEGADPALQPTLVGEQVFEPTELDLTFVVAPGEGFPISMVEK